MVDDRPRLTWAGTLPFEAALAANLAAVERVQATGIPELLAFEPAAAVYTLGKRAQTPAGRAALASTLATCAARGLAVRDVDRGGLGTLHGPGQLVVFVAWPCERTGLRALVAQLLEATADLCRDLGVPASIDLGELVAAHGDDVRADRRSALDARPCDHDFFEAICRSSGDTMR